MQGFLSFYGSTCSEYQAELHKHQRMQISRVKSANCIPHSPVRVSLQTCIPYSACRMPYIQIPSFPAAAFGFYAGFLNQLNSLWASAGQPEERNSGSRINSYALRNPARASEASLHSFIGDMHAKVLGVQSQPLLAHQQGLSPQLHASVRRKADVLWIGPYRTLISSAYPHFCSVEVML